MIARTSEAEKGAGALPGKYLACNLGSESYAIAVPRVREIIRLVEITPIPRMPAFIKGVINLRGKIVPVVDLRLRFGMEAFTAGNTTCIVVVQIALQSGAPGNLGLIVDGVEEVFNLAQNEIEPTPEFGSGVDRQFLPALARIKGKVTAVVDIDRVLTPESLKDAGLISENTTACKN